MRAILEIDPCPTQLHVKKSDPKIQNPARTERRQTSLLLPLQLLFSLFQDKEGWILRGDSEMTCVSKLQYFTKLDFPETIKGVSFAKQLFGVKTRVRSP